MLISGFSFVRNATKLYYPVKASIGSILPIVDEFIIAVGKGDSDDNTLQEIRQLASPKIKIIQTEWDLGSYPDGNEYAHQTDIAKKECKGDWLFYLQSDEVVHEKYLPVIKKRCAELLENKKAEGLLFDYIHFWGDYDHHIISHKWYPREIRIIRNKADIHSWRDAQSFRRIPGFDGKNYFQKKGAYKLHVAAANAAIFHYGWVRPPALMQQKRISFETHMQGETKTREKFQDEPSLFNYGNLDALERFQGTHPVVMNEFMNRFDWQDELEKGKANPVKHKHDKMKYRLLTMLEQKLLNGRQIGGFKNYNLIKA